MLPPRARAVWRLATAVLDVTPLINVLPSPVPIAADCSAALLDAVRRRLGAPPFDVRPSAAAADLDPFARVVSDRLRAAAEAAGGEDALDDVDEAVAAAVADSFDERYPVTPVPAGDGTVLQARALGRPAAEAVVVVSACGMPAKLCEPWLRRLARDHYVLTHDTRGLFGDIDGFSGATGVPAQAADVLAVTEHFGVSRAHLVGLCGGAVVSLAFAADHPRRVASMSLWHGDYELGPDCPRTEHQRNLRALLDMTADGRVSAESMFAVMSGSMLRGTPPGLAHLVLYPYATPRLLKRYCRLNGAIMGTDARACLPAVSGIRTLVVTSEDDATAHPEGSRRVAAAIPGARLHVAPTGDHLSLFEGRPELLELAASFVRDAS
ncbi:alpha/beta hydrolase [Micromonospora tulbaghiae]|uniref:alpha/beta fold hydrolase n=1 Tax=Micromonospora tulbaghiae TaxID=479978 RepID=UPI0033D8617E